MAQLERVRTSTHVPRTHPLSRQTSPTFEQLIRSEETKWSSRSISPRFVVNSDQEEYLNPSGSRRSSMLDRVRERAKKLRHSLSGRRKITTKINETPDTYIYPDPWGSSLPYVEHNPNNVDENNEELEGDPEYLGAPMYESEAAPEILKENARQHPRAVPVISESHKMPADAKGKEVAHPRAMPIILESHNTPTHAKGKEVAQQEKLAQQEEVAQEEKVAQQEEVTRQDNKPQDLINRTASHKFSGLTIRTAEDANVTQGTASNAERSVSDEQNSTDASSPQKWDKGVSVKEYFMHKLEPGEDERALSHAITEAISPRKGGNTDSSVVQKVKGAVASILWRQKSANKISPTAADASSSKNSTNEQTWSRQNSTNSRPSESYNAAHDHHRSSSPQFPVSYNAAHDRHHSSSPQIPISYNAAHSPQIPISYNAYKDIEEENHGKILQAN